MKILIVGDSPKLTKLYREDLLVSLGKSFSVLLVGIRTSLFKSIFLSVRADYIISSNLRSNFFVSIFFWKKGAIILNGLGRKRRDRFFRLVLLQTMFLSRKKIFFVQNYLDFRYLRRLKKNHKLFWICGSGGSQRKLGGLDCPFIVSRDGKIQLQADSVKLFKREVGLKLNGVGLEKSHFDGFVVGCGYVAQAEIFMFGNTLVHLTGYGEGVPHCLVDGLVSGVDIIIERRALVEFGLSRRVSIIHEFGQFCLVRAPEKLKSELSVENINAEMEWLIKQDVFGCLKAA